ncbi:AAA ATPase domain-containing protein [Streptomyces sp. 3213]|uniref:helix-turn-helix transcriptional regulator n=1 Tax=Streptomyces sp. 3213.3 TaxID=1855348 RepID=UPI000894993A|nr:LuxR family transcriptional regulator [Streptomyces sp. 3213.3]SEE99256.1 AAA ATPase domain-containing protein [Streptomyces sp. 3213] [Streptomyces sp. 3213.3]
MTSRPGADLVGRTAELGLLDSLLTGRDGACRGLLLRGDPGVGKTALLGAAAARAGDLGTRVLRASGVEFEREMNFSALHQMLYPLRRHTGRLAGHHRAVVDRIFGLAPRPPPDPLAASTAVLALLGEVATDALSDHRYLVLRMIERERDGGAIAMVVPALLLLCHDTYVHGRWDEAEHLAQQGLDLAAAHGYHFWERQIRVLLASGVALRGDADLARTRSEETTTWAAPRGIEVTEAYARSARRVAAMGEGDYEEAHDQVGRIEPPGAPVFGVPRRWTVLDLAETAVRTGRADEARDHVAAARRASVHRISPRTALICAGAEAVVADETEAGPLFEAALNLPHAARWPWEHARVQLAYGQWLRRTRDHRARRYLSAALETFDRIGARAMAQRARNELRATGVATTTGPLAAAAALTVQERQIAELAAVGLTNRQIGERLFLSHRTVGSHLHRLYPKLGITSRAALRAALETM